MLRETISREKTVLAIDDEDAGVAHLLLAAVQRTAPDAYLAIVVPKKRKNDAHDVNELLLIGALDRQAALDGVRNNAEYVLEHLGRPHSVTEKKWVQRRIKEARELFRDETLFLNDRPLGWPPQWPRST